MFWAIWMLQLLGGMPGVQTRGLHGAAKASPGTACEAMMWTVLSECGPLHTRGQLPKYLKRLREPGRGEWADRLAVAHPGGGLAGRL